MWVLADRLDSGGVHSQVMVACLVVEVVLIKGVLAEGVLVLRLSSVDVGHVGVLVIVRILDMGPGGVVVGCLDVRLAVVAVVRVADSAVVVRVLGIIQVMPGHGTVIDRATRVVDTVIVLVERIIHHGVVAAIMERVIDGDVAAGLD